MLLYLIFIIKFIENNNFVIKFIVINYYDFYINFIIYKILLMCVLYLFF